MKTTVINYLFILLFLNSVQSFAQDELYSLNYGDVIQSPTAESFAKYGYTPVSPYTGVPNISIPVWDLKVGDIEMPVSLSYHAGGIKVEEIASWVGLGWNLNVGGVITRQIKELPDFEYGAVWSIYYNSLVQNGNVSSQLFERKTDRYSKDAQPDIFTYNFNGYVGQFVVDRYNGTCIPLNNHRDLKMEYQFQNGVVYFEITTPDGIVYQFKDIEKQEVWVKSYSTRNEQPTMWVGLGDYKYECVSAWYLTKITSVKTGHTVTFNYDDQYEKIDVFSEPTAYYYYPYDDELNPATGLKRSTQGAVIQSNLRLTNITTSNDISVDFIPKNRNDLYKGQGKALSEIVISYDGNPEKSFLFNHDYFCAEGKTVSNAYPNELRLKLTSFCERGKPGYEFRYNETHQLPPRWNIPFFPGEFVYNDKKNKFLGSYAKDFLGYYNGKTENTTFKEGLELDYTQKSFKYYIFSRLEMEEIPGLSNGDGICEKDNDEDECKPITSTITGINEIHIDEPGADRTPSLDHCQAYTLNEITYPTGAKTQYSYELHDYSHIGIEYKGEHFDFPGLRIKEIKNIKSDGATENVRTFYYNELYENNTNTNISSGALVKDINYHSETWIIKHYNTSDGGYADVKEGRTFVDMSNKGTRDVYDYTGGFLGYSTVKEDLNGNGFIIYNYNNANTSFKPDYFISRLFRYCEFYYCDSVNVNGFTGIFLTYSNESFSEGWKCFANRRGLLTSKIYLDNDLFPVKEVRNIYRYIDNEDVLYGMERVMRGFDPGNFLLGLYSFSSRFSELASTSTQYFYDDVSENRTSARNFEEDYSYNDYGQLSQKSFYNSTNPKKSITYYKYASDYNNLDHDDINYSRHAEGIKSMKEKNYINVPLEIVNTTKTEDEEKVIGAKSYHFKRKNMYYQPDEYIITLDESKTLEIPSPVSSEFNHSEVVYDAGLNEYIVSADDRYKLEDTYNTDQWGNIKQIRKKNGFFTSLIWDYNHSYPIAKVENAEYTDIFHTSFENSDHPNVKEVIDAKTGRKVCEIPPSAFWPENIEKGSISHNRKYIFQGAFKTSNNFTGSAVMVIKVWGMAGKLMAWLPVYISNTQGEWKIYQREINTNDYPGLGWLELEIYNPGGNEAVLVDEVRFHPADAQMATYTYDPLIGMTSETDPNNQTTYYEYDGLGRLQYIKDKERNIVEKYDYHYANQEEIEIYNCENVTAEMEDDAHNTYQVRFWVTGLDEGTGCYCKIDYGDGSPIEDIGKAPQTHEYPNDNTYTATFNFYNANDQLVKTIDKEVTPPVYFTAEVENHAYYIHRVNFWVTGIDEGTGCYCKINYGDGSPVENIGTSPQYHVYPDDNTYTATFNFYNAYNQLVSTITKQVNPPADENPVVPEIVKITDDLNNKININNFVLDGSGTSHIRIYTNLPSTNTSGCYYPIIFQVIGYDHVYENERIVYSINTDLSQEYFSVYHYEISDTEYDDDKESRYYIKIRNKSGCNYLDHEILYPDCVTNYYDCGFKYNP